MSTRSRQLTQAELDQLFWYAEQAKDSGVYYGFRPFFQKRHANIIVWLKRLEQSQKNSIALRRENEALRAALKWLVEQVSDGEGSETANAVGAARAALGRKP